MRCKFQKSNGQRCSANAMIGAEFCFSHNPAVKEKKKAAVIKGGKMSKKNRSLLSPINLAQPKDVVSLLNATINEVRGGCIELRVANCLGYLSGHLMKAFEAADLEERLSKIEKALAEKNLMLL